MKKYAILCYRIGLIITAFALISMPSVNAQQLGQYSQYTSNILVINPAYAGADEALSLTIVNRSQWSGVEGAPSTQTFTGHSMYKQQNFGLGIILAKDKIGVHSNFDALGVYSYRLSLGKNTYLSMGMQVGLHQSKSDYASLISQTQMPNDPKLNGTSLNRTSLEIGTGIFFRNQKLQIGLSVPKLFPGKSNLNDSISIKLNRSHYFLLFRYLIPIDHHVKIQPGLLLKHLPGLPLSWDMNINVIVKEVLMLGTSFRSSGAMTSALQAKVTPQLKFGYAFDFPVGKISALKGSSHELMLNYVFKYNSYGISGSR